MSAPRLGCRRPESGPHSAMNLPPTIGSNSIPLSGDASSLSLAPPPAYDAPVDAPLAVRKLSRCSFISLRLLSFLSLLELGARVFQSGNMCRSCISTGEFCSLYFDEIDKLCECCGHHKGKHERNPATTAGKCIPPFVYLVVYYLFIFLNCASYSSAGASDARPLPPTVQSLSPGASAAPEDGNFSSPAPSRPSRKFDGCLFFLFN
jgi:hypothetical protein